MTGKSIANDFQYTKLKRKQEKKQETKQTKILLVLATIICNNY